MNFHHISKVYRKDWYRILRNPVAILVILGICAIPSLYAWINVQACWDLYNNLQDLPVAVVNNDKEASFRGTSVNVGQQIVTELKKNKKVKWVFTTSKEADMGLIDSTYYASIEIPSDFSSNLLSVLSDKPHKPQIIYKADTKANAVANKITSTVSSTVVQQVKSEFVSTVNELAYKAVNSVGNSASQNEGSILKTKDAIISLNRNMETITDTLQTVSSNSTSLSELLSNLNSSMPAVQSSLDSLAKSNVNSQQSLSTMQKTMDLSTKSISANLEYAKSSGEKIRSLFLSLNDAATNTADEKVDTIVPVLSVQLGSLNSTVDSTITFLEKCRDYDYASDMDSAIASLKQLRSALQSLQDGLTKLQKGVDTVHTTTDQTYQSLQTLFAQTKVLMQQMDTALNDAITAVTELSTTFPQNATLKSILKSLKSIQDAHITTVVSTEMDNLLATQPKVDNAFVTLNSNIAGAQIKIKNAISTIDRALSDLQKFRTQTFAAQTQQVNALISALQAVKPDIATLQGNLGTLSNQLHSGTAISRETANQLSTCCGNIVEHLTTSLALYNSNVKSDLKRISTGLSKTITGTNDLIQSAKELSTQISTMLKNAQQGAQLSASFSNGLYEKLTQFKSVISALGGKLDTTGNESISTLIAIMQNNPKLIGNYVAEPFDIQEEAIYPIPNYGTGMTPLYTTLALWVGCLILNSVLKPEVAWFDGIEKITMREKYFGKMLLFATLAAVQGLIVSVGDIVYLKIYVLHPAMFIFFSVYSSLVFSIITYTLMATLGNFGKALSIIYLIMQIAGAGGSYPVQVDPPIFRVLQPLFPFTYTLSGMREAIAGSLASTVTGDVVGLTIFGLLFLFGGYFTLIPLNRTFHKFEVDFQKSGLGE